MHGAAIDNSVWSLEGTVARVAGDGHVGTVDVTRPDLGIGIRRDFASRPSYTLLRASRTGDSTRADSQRRDAASIWPLPVAESYVRGGDLVASYHATDDWPYSPQIYWQWDQLRAVEGVSASLSLLVSIQTHLLDTRPKISVDSQLGATELLRISMDDLGNGEIDQVDCEQTFAPIGRGVCAIYRLPESPLSYAEFVRTSDVHEVAIRRNPHGQLCAEWRLFAEFLEKGVIRRARVNGAFLRRERDVELALECCRAIEQRPLPLTT